MKPLDALRQRRPPLTFGHMVTFTAGAVVGSILSVYVGPARTSWIMIGFCWLVAIALMIFEGSGISRSSSRVHPSAAHRRGPSGSGPIHPQPPPASTKPAVQPDLSGGAKRSRLRAIAGGKGQPPSSAS